eukprot:s8_g60.t1
MSAKVKTDAGNDDSLSGIAAEVVQTPHTTPDPQAGEDPPARPDEKSMPFAVEFCSGTAGLTAQLRKGGMTSAFGVDHIIKAGNKAPVVKLDIATPEGEELARSYIQSPLCAYAHFGLPCGTSSRAREIEVPGMKTPPAPLRDADWPDGKPNLPKRDAERVAAANRVYAAGCCRPKRTTIATDVAELAELECECTNQHAHLPWGYTPQGFATAAEVEYPLELCRQWAAIIIKVVESRYKATMTPLPSHPDKRARAHSMKQTRKSLAFMPDWSHVETISLSTMPPFTVGTKLSTDYTDAAGTIPVHSRILRITAAPLTQDGGDQSGVVQVAYGVPWTEEAFIEEARRRGHPANLVDGLSKGMRGAVNANVKLEPDMIVFKRAQWFKKWTSRAFELRKLEEELHSKFPPNRKNILKGKRFLVLREILEDLGYPDLQIVQDMQDGFSLVGVAEGGGILPAEFQPATLSLQDLDAHSARSNQAIFHSTKSSGDEKVDKELWAKTEAEVEKGWLKELPGMPADGGRVSRRFAVVQGEKVRPIDNYIESQINDAVSVTGRCTVDGVDIITGMGAELMRALKQEGKPTKLRGRSFDLKSAYRQLAVRDDSLKWARLAVFCPSDRSTRCFQQYSLPFGAKASVVAFLRCARMIQWIAHHLEIAATCYFDDYVCLAPEVVACNSEKTFELLLDLLGREFDKSGDKADRISETVSALGVLFDLSQTSDGFIMVQNTEKRKADISAQISEVLEAGRMSSAKAASLKGRLGFAEGQLFGRAIRRLVNELGRHAMPPPPRGKFLDETRRALELVGQRIVTAGPRRVEATTSEVLYLFTDASFDQEHKNGGLGAVYVHPRAKDFFATEQQLRDVLAQLAKGIDKDDDPILGDDEVCVSWYGDVTKEDLQAAIRMVKPGENAESVTYVNRVLAFIFATDESWDKLMKLPKAAFKMGCGDQLCVHVTHIVV